MSDNHDVIVVGGGISGLLATLALAKEGKDALLLEKSSFLGGNCRTYNVEGFWVDTGPHAITHIDDGPLPRLMEKYFDYLPYFIPYGNYYIRSKSRLTKFPWTAQDWVKFSVLPRKDRIQLAQTIASAVTSSSFGSKDLNQSVYDYLKKHSFSTKTWRFIDAFSYFMSGVSMHETPAWRMMKGARYLDESKAVDLSKRFRGQVNKFIKLVRFHGAYHQAYPRRGIQSITECVVHSFPEKKATVKKGEEVKEILVKDGKVRGVATDKDTYQGDLVVFSGYTKTLPGLITGGLPERYLDNLNKLKQSNTLTIWLGLREKYNGFNYQGSEIWFEEEMPYWATPTSNHDNWLAPEGKQLVGFSTFADGKQRDVKEKLLETIYTVHPELEKLVEVEHTQQLIPEKAAISVGAQFPGQESPIEGLYLVGTDTDYRSMGVTRAAFSVEKLLEILKKKRLV
ncbi:phytoene desaturase family protein [Candidatus Altiarchaeota archaeon]